MNRVSVGGGDLMTVVIKDTNGDIVNIRSAEPITKFTDLMNDLARLIQ